MNLGFLLDQTIRKKKKQKFSPISRWLSYIMEKRGEAREKK
jgi:hypothetical protein